MTDLYEKQRKYVADDFKKSVEVASNYAKIQVENASNYAARRQEYLTAVTERYRRLGYFMLEKGEWNDSCGEYKTTSSYLRELAREMQRPFITLKCNGIHHSYDRTSGTLSTCHMCVITFPIAKKYQPLYIEMALVATNCRDGISVVRDNYYSSRIRFTLYGDDKNHHPLVDYWRKRMEMDAQWRALVNLPIYPRQRCTEKQHEHIASTKQTRNLHRQLREDAVRL